MIKTKYEKNFKMCMLDNAIGEVIALHSDHWMIIRTNRSKRGRVQRRKKGKKGRRKQGRKEDKKTGREEGNPIDFSYLVY